MAIQSSIFAWRIPRTEEPGRSYSPRGRKESDTTELTHVHTHTSRHCYFQNSCCYPPPGLKQPWFAKHVQALYTTETSTLSLERPTLHAPQAGDPGFNPRSGN